MTMKYLALLNHFFHLHIISFILTYKIPVYNYQAYSYILQGKQTSSNCLQVHLPGIDQP